MLGKVSLAAIAVVAAAVGASSVNPRELYNEMYPVEAMKRDAFHICRDANPAFIRAVKGDREACFDSMPHLIAVALGRVRPTAALALALLDPSHQAELLLTLAAMPPRQPITVPKSFANTAWMRALSSGCEDKTTAMATATVSARTPAPAANTRVVGRASALPANLPGLPQAARAGAARQPALPVIPLAGNAVPGRDAGEQAAASNEPAVADLGDKGPPAIVPLAAAGNCGGA
jgi:hypothetical protein